MCFPSSTAAVRWLCILVVICSNAVLAGSHAFLPTGAETESAASFTEDGWSAAMTGEEANRTRSLFSDDALLDTLSNGGLVTGASELAQTEIQQEAAPQPPAPAPKSTKGAKRSIRVPLIAAVLLFALCLEIIKLRIMKAPVASTRPQRSEQEQPQREVKLEQLLYEMSDLEKAQPMVVYLAETVGTERAVSALQKFRSALEQLEPADQMAVGVSSSSLVHLKEAVDDGVAALAELLQATRERGLSLAQDLQGERLPSFSDEEIEMLGNRLGAGFRKFLDIHKENLEFGFTAGLSQAEKAATDLKEMPDVKCTQDVKVLAGALASMEMIKAVDEAMQAQQATFEDIRVNSTTALVMSHQRDQEHLHREFKAQVDEQRVLCCLDEERQRGLPEPEKEVVEGLKWIQEQLEKADDLLKTHKELMDHTANAGDIVFASKMEVESRSVLNKLSEVLEGTAKKRRSLPGAITVDEAAHTKAMQRHLRLVALKTSEDAVAATERVAGIMAALDVQAPTAVSSMWEALDGQRRNPESLMKPPFGRMIASVMKQVEDAKAAVRKPDDDDVEGTTSVTRTMELVLAARLAAKAAAAFSHEAELMWLRAQLNDSVEADMQLSTLVGWKAMAAADPATGREDQPRQFWTIRMGAGEALNFQNMVSQLNAEQQKARAADGLNEVAAAAARMKQAAYALTAFVQQHEKVPLTTKMRHAS